jgi:hypothetical protein
MTTIERLLAIEKRLAALERDSHPPIDLEPAIRDILGRYAQPAMPKKGAKK